jgi:hypothetical protein
MGAIKVNFHNQKEEKVLLSILDSLDYDYEAEHTLVEEELIAKALERSQKDIKEGRTLPHSVVMESIKLKYGI